MGYGEGCALNSDNPDEVPYVDDHVDMLGVGVKVACQHVYGVGDNGN